MSAVTIMRDETGRLAGVGENGARAYAKWRKVVEQLPIGQTLTFRYHLPRSPAHHRLFFAKLGSLLARTETFDDLDKLRYWLVMGAGYFDLIPGLDGQPNAIPRSLNFDTMDEADFSELHRQVDQFLWTPRAQAVLWPELNADGRYACVDSFMRASRSAPCVAGAQDG
jgi:hypothetical protein